MVRRIPGWYLKNPLYLGSNLGQITWVGCTTHLGEGGSMLTWIVLKERGDPDTPPSIYIN